MAYSWNVTTFRRRTAARSRLVILLEIHQRQIRNKCAVCNDCRALETWKFSKDRIFLGKFSQDRIFLGKFSKDRIFLGKFWRDISRVSVIRKLSILACLCVLRKFSRESSRPLFSVHCCKQCSSLKSQLTLYTVWNCFENLANQLTLSGLYVMTTYRTV